MEGRDRHYYLAENQRGQARILVILYVETDIIGFYQKRNNVVDVTLSDNFQYQRQFAK